MDYGEGSASDAGFPPQPSWFEGNLHFDNIENGLKATGMSDEDVAGVMGENWLRFYDKNFGPETT
jgi:microsomal dipeptidase-like Zn-dependent dipeptidase